MNSWHWHLAAITPLLYLTRIFYPPFSHVVSLRSWWQAFLFPCCHDKSLRSVWHEFVDHFARRWYPSRLVHNCSPSLFQSSAKSLRSHCNVSRPYSPCNCDLFNTISTYTLLFLSNNRLRFVSLLFLWTFGEVAHLKSYSLSSECIYLCSECWR